MNKTIIFDTPPVTAIEPSDAGSECRNRPARSLQRTSLLWLAYAVAAMEMTAPANAQLLYPKGSSPAAGVIRDSAGNLYGTALHGGAYTNCNGFQLGCGVVYKLDTAGHQRVLYSFMGGTDGAYPYAPVIRDSAGNLYGTTYAGGTGCTGNLTPGCGVVYKLDPAGDETVLYRFTGGADGSEPFAGLARDAAGNLYGTTTYGGMGLGVVYKLDSAGHETVLHTFTGGADGDYPVAGVILDPEGNLYGTTCGGFCAGMSTDYGLVYKLDTAGNYEVKYTFTGGTDGANPQAGVIRDAAGNLYGTTTNGGAANEGVVYELDAAGETVLYAFCAAANCADGALPIAGVIHDAAGNLYGTTYAGGTSGAGIVYRLDTAGQESVLCFFDAAVGNEGYLPVAGVIRDPAGNLYGTTEDGGTADAGLVYKLNTARLEKVLYTFPSRP